MKGLLRLMRSTCAATVVTDQYNLLWAENTLTQHFFIETVRFIHPSNGKQMRETKCPFIVSTLPATSVMALHTLYVTCHNTVSSL